MSDKDKCQEGEFSSPGYFTPETLAILRKNLCLSQETWEALFRADPTGWRALLGDGEGE